MGEGAGLLVIEELVGCGTSADAYHMTAGPEDGSGARQAMQQALRQAGVEAVAVQYLNAPPRSTWKRPTQTPRASTWCAAKPGGGRWNMRYPMASAAVG